MKLNIEADYECILLKCILFEMPENSENYVEDLHGNKIVFGI